MQTCLVDYYVFIFMNTLNQHSSLNVGDEGSQPDKTVDKIITSHILNFKCLDR
jgi:hypothetical protein